MKFDNKWYEKLKLALSITNSMKFDNKRYEKLKIG